ncbi:AAT family amino acid transporter [[Emmonsia] crescens]|uniref:AAT family amino acid transporter n=1 Tax=[Emmonsia] crescens TaxID=73230 RepID=A0A2B7ZQQ2_9EURO|nr:AAT family amino acid transporter [Emmonsia crescens]
MRELVDQISLAQDEKATKGMEGNPSSGPLPHDSDELEKYKPPELPQLQRRLKSRHLQMIAIGGTIGTGLFIGSGGAISQAGPAGALIAYAFVGSIVYSVIVSLGEMATYIPIAGAFTSYATRFVDPSLGFAMGWIYWFSWAITFALELTATGLIIQYWNDDIPIGIFIAVFWIFITSINMLPVSFYGEIEFWFSSIKVITVIGFMIFGICMNAGAGQQGYLGFKYWHTPGAFAPYLLEVIGHDKVATAKFIGFWATLIQAGFSYQGTELVGIAAGETENPRKAVPAAIKKTFYRILFLFVLTIFFIGILIPYTNKDLLSKASNASASPFVIAANLAGVKTLPGLINAVLLTVVLSAANSNVYSGSRIIVGLAQDGCAPRFFTKTTKGGVPILSVLFTAAFGLLGFLNLSNSGSVVFEWFMNISSIAGFISWSCINGCHLSFMRALRARNLSRDALPYKAPFQPYLAWYGLFFNILIIITQGFTAFLPWKVSNFFISYISLILFVVLYSGHKIIYRTSFVKPWEADLDTGRLGLDAETWETTKVPTTVWERVQHRMYLMFC